MRPSPYDPTRNVQRRILMLAGLLVLVLLLMQQAQKGENFHWLWHLQGQPIPSTQDEKVDTRVRNTDAQATKISEIGPLVTGILTEDERRADPPPTGEKPSEGQLAQKSPLDQARTDAWTGLIDALEDGQRHLLLLGLKSSREGQSLPDDVQPHWSDLLHGLDEGWQRYLSEARQSLEDERLELTETERQQWLDVLATLETQWLQQSRPALAALAESPQVSAEDRAAIDRIQAELDIVFLNAIRDNTVFRSAEMDAWFRLFERLSRGEAAEHDMNAAPMVSFGQLFRQPDVYRGRLVTVLGSVRRVEFMNAPENLYGIERYFRLVLEPVGANSPIIIYSLELPDGFPALRLANQPGTYVDLDEDVQITGYFFKRWPYPARDGTRLAPVVLTRSFSWTPGVAALTDPDNLPRPVFWAVLLIGTAVFGIAIALLVYWLSGQTTPLALRKRLTSASKKGSAP
jgi:hypothetical protein